MISYCRKIAILGFLISCVHSEAYADSAAKQGIDPAAEQQNISLEGQQISIAYYKIKSGHEDEWLSLYKNYHLKFIDGISATYGMTSTNKSSNIYHTKSHRPGGWDFAVVRVTPKHFSAPALSHDRIMAIVKQLFGSVQAFQDAENKRWELTELHWDDDFVEQSLDPSPLSGFGS